MSHLLPDVMAEIERHREAGKPTDAITIARQIFRETHSVGSYLLPDIPEQLWIAAKYKAVDEEPDHAGAHLEGPA